MQRARYTAKFKDKIIRQVIDRDNPVTMAVWRRRPKSSVMIHSNQGKQFGSDEFSRLVQGQPFKP